MFAHKKNLSFIAALVACITVAGHVMAAEEIEGIEPNANAADNGSVPLLSGGVGDDELNYIKSVQHQYNLKLLFTETSGVFLSDLPVIIRDKSGHTVVNTVTKGPILLVTLPTGSYTVAATDGAMNHEEKISISGHGLRTYQFRFQGNDQKNSD